MSLSGSTSNESINIAITELLHYASINFKIEETIVKLKEQGFFLDALVPSTNSSLLHMLIKFAPLHIIKNILSKETLPINLDVRDQLGKTPLMIAAEQKRPQLYDYLITLGANPMLVNSLGQTAQMIFCRNKLSIDKTPTIYQHFCETLSNEKSFTNITADFEKTLYIFEKLKKFSNEYKWKYDGKRLRAINTEGILLIDCGAKENITVNCFDMAYLFGNLTKVFCHNEIKIHIYENYKSKNFNQPDPKINPGFICFDSQAQAHFVSVGTANFNQHCVVNCLGNFYFDPTFSCYYEGAQTALNAMPTTGYLNASAELSSLLCKFTTTEETFFSMQLLQRSQKPGICFPLWVAVLKAKTLNDYDDLSKILKEIPYDELYLDEKIYDVSPRDLLSNQIFIKIFDLLITLSQEEKAEKQTIRDMRVLFDEFIQSPVQTQNAIWIKIKMSCIKLIEQRENIKKLNLEATQQQQVFSMFQSSIPIAPLYSSYSSNNSSTTVLSLKRPTPPNKSGPF